MSPGMKEQQQSKQGQELLLIVSSALVGCKMILPLMFDKIRQHILMMTAGDLLLILLPPPLALQ